MFGKLQSLNEQPVSALLADELNSYRAFCVVDIVQDAVIAQGNSQPATGLGCTAMTLRLPAVGWYRK